MKVFLNIFLLSYLLAIKAFSQKISPNYYEDIAPIISKNCSPCHRPNNIGPFNLLTYEDVVKRAKFIDKVTSSRYMPPFPADRTFQGYLNERGLSESEIDLIKNWVNSGMKEGKKQLQSEGELNNFSETEPDLILKMNAPFDISAENIEDFRFFNLPSRLEKDIYLSGIGFKPGNKQLVHHSRVMLDTTNLIRAIDGLSEMDSKVKDFQKYGLKEEFLYGWVPGNDYIKFPKGTGIKVNKNADFLLNMHYAPSPIADTDQSEIVLFFSKKEVQREVKNFILRENDVSNKPFLIRGGEQKTFYIAKNISKDISLISVLPHMHLLGKSFRAFAVTPNSEVINLIKIDKWDFNWQMTYQFKKMLKIPAGSTFIVEATYDNSENNPENPYSPPQDIGYGWGTKDEMLNLVLYYLDYHSGDELIDQSN